MFTLKLYFVLKTMSLNLLSVTPFKKECKKRPGKLRNAQKHMEHCRLIANNSVIIGY